MSGDLVQAQVTKLQMAARGRLLSSAVRGVCGGGLFLRTVARDGASSLNGRVFD